MSNPWQARHGLTSAAYQAEFDKWLKQGYRLTSLSGYAVNGDSRYAAIWEKRMGPAWQARHGLNGAAYQSAFNELANQGYRPIRVCGYDVGGQPQFAAVWEKSSGTAWKARHGMTGAAFQLEFDVLKSQGYRLVELCGYADGGEARYAAIWEQRAGPAWQARHGLDSAAYQAEFDRLANEGYQLARVSGYTVGGQAYYTAIWEKSAGPVWYALHGLTSVNYQAEFDNCYYQGYRPLWVSGYTVGNQPYYAAIWLNETRSRSDLDLIDTKIRAYMQQHNIPGLSMAVTKQERLVFAKGYGFSDLATRELVSPNSLFRIASISKPITAVAIMELVESSPLTLDQKVFGPGAILGTQYGTKPYSTNVKMISVRHLLQHTSGWSNKVAGEDKDPMFQNPQMTQSQLIGWVLDSRAPVNPPGKAADYLNFGYCVLGRVIEKVSGKSYEEYVKSAVLSKCGISRMRIGAELQIAKAPGEVTYYGGSPYALLPHRMDAHGGWIATPIDLLRIMARVDGFAAKMDLLTASDETAMNTTTPVSPTYGLGWIVEGNYRGHNGGMHGSAGFLVRRNDGLSYAFLENTRPSGDEYSSGLKTIMDEIVTKVEGWPAYDLF